MGVLLEWVIIPLVVFFVIYGIIALVRKRDPAEVAAVLRELKRERAALRRATEEQIALANEFEDLVLIERQRLGLVLEERVDVETEQRERHEQRRLRVLGGD